MQNAALGAIVLAGLTLSCKTQPTPKAAIGWEEAKRNQKPDCALKALYQEPHQQPMSSLAWEDGVYVSRDGLSLYSDYFLIDLLQFVYSGADMGNVWIYRRGPDLGQDFSNPLGKPHDWIHSDLIVSTRKSKAVPFGPWHLTQLRGKYYNLAGFATVGKTGAPGRFDYAVYTHDASGGVKIKLMRNVGQDLAADAKGAYLPANVDDPRYHADNPHMERTKPGHLVLFFDSDNRPGKGQHDIFVTVSEDDGKTWTDPSPVGTVNSAEDEIQPHLFMEKGRWWLYLATVNPADHKLGIFRYVQARPGDWDSWTNRELVVGAGSSAAVGEPTLTEDGDLSFVVVTVNVKGGTATDKFDCDAWYMKRRRGR